MYGTSKTRALPKTCVNQSFSATCKAACMAGSSGTAEAVSYPNLSESGPNQRFPKAPIYLVEGRTNREIELHGRDGLFRARNRFGDCLHSIDCLTKFGAGRIEFEKILRFLLPR